MWGPIVIVVAAVVASAPARGDAGRLAPDVKADALMAQYRAASGGAALDRHDAFHETGTIVRDG